MLSENNYSNRSHEGTHIVQKQLHIAYVNILIPHIENDIHKKHNHANKMISIELNTSSLSLDLNRFESSS